MDEKSITPFGILQRIQAKNCILFRAEKIKQITFNYVLLVGYCCRQCHLPAGVVCLTHPPPPSICPPSLSPHTPHSGLTLQPPPIISELV